jgi:hypothetical protein
MNNSESESESESEYSIINNNDNLIVCFGGISLKMGGILPFEFLNYLSSIYTDNCDSLFYIDKNQCWYHKGIYNITTNIEDTVVYLNKKIANGHYKKVLFMGTSAGGYASILFGSLCDNVHGVIGFIPQTMLHNPINNNYSNLKPIINTKTNYILCGDTSIQDKNNTHHILQCENIDCFSNVQLIKMHGVDLKQLRDNGFIKQLLDGMLIC